MRHITVRPGETIVVNGVSIRAPATNTTEVYVAAHPDDLPAAGPGAAPALEPDGADEPVVLDGEGW